MGSISSCVDCSNIEQPYSAKPISRDETFINIAGYLQYFNTTTECSKVPFPNYQYIDKDRLENILNGIIAFDEPSALANKCGSDLLEALVNQCGSEHKISFIVHSGHGDEFEVELSNIYSFQSENALADPRELYIIVQNELDKTTTRVVFDGERTKNFQLSHFDESVNIDAYLSAHELAHVVSFLYASKTIGLSQKSFEARKNDWAGFLSTARMDPINRELLDKNLPQATINAIFESLFDTTEEARNLLGFEVDGKRVGEYYLFNKKNNFLLPLYLESERNLTENEKLVLKTIAKHFGIQLQTRCEI